MAGHPQPSTPQSTLRPLPRWIFASRWLQAPLYIGLIVAQAVYVVQFVRELVHLVQIVGLKDIAETEIMLKIGRAHV